MKVAIVGSGIAGPGAAHTLADHADITLFEAGSWFGGHTHTVDVTLPTPLTARNEFEMPALITAQQAAQEILHGWSTGRFEIHFPRRFTLVMKLLRRLPFRLYRTVVRRITGL